MYTDFIHHSYKLLHLKWKKKIFKNSNLITIRMLACWKNKNLYRRTTRLFQHQWRWIDDYWLKCVTSLFHLNVRKFSLQFFKDVIRMYFYFISYASRLTYSYQKWIQWNRRIRFHWLKNVNIHVYTESHSYYNRFKSVSNCLVYIFHNIKWIRSYETISPLV